MIEHTRGHITLPNGKQLECIDFQIDIEETLPPVSEKQRRVSEIIREMQGKSFAFRNIYGEYSPSGPVIDSTLAGESEERQ